MADHPGVDPLSWATPYIQQLQAGATVQFRPRGNSMTPLIRSGQLVTVVPLGTLSLARGDIVLCRVRGKQFLHKITGVRPNQYQISNNHGHVNGWCSGTSIYGVLIEIAP